MHHAVSIIALFMVACTLNMKGNLELQQFILYIKMNFVNKWLHKVNLWSYCFVCIVQTRSSSRASLRVLLKPAVPWWSATMTEFWEKQVGLLSITCTDIWGETGPAAGMMQKNVSEKCLLEPVLAWCCRAWCQGSTSDSWAQWAQSDMQALGFCPELQQQLI